ncbi:hypothetical protein [Mesorhizobium sp. BH1-1-5]|uniref:hypothetical protein n=1 Tax=Mesorhizobium sp. BH1-1-5 TaxID=2876661 RepID=UPI0029623D6F|nr:hypothetical protein [Mesorhizobium sp. BH1-1-5]
MGGSGGVNAGVGASVGGSGGVNAGLGASVGGSGGVKASATASVGGSNGVNAGVSANVGNGVNVGLGLGIGGDTSDPGNPSNLSKPGNLTKLGLPGAVASMSGNQLARMKKRCVDVLSSEGTYDGDLRALCLMIARRRRMIRAEDPAGSCARSRCHAGAAQRPTGSVGPAVRLCGTLLPRRLPPAGGALTRTSGQSGSLPHPWWASCYTVLGNRLA